MLGAWRELLVSAVIAWVRVRVYARVWKSVPASACKTKSVCACYERECEFLRWVSTLHQFRFLAPTRPEMKKRRLFETMRRQQRRRRRRHEVCDHEEEEEEENNYSICWMTSSRRLWFWKGSIFVAAFQRKETKEAFFSFLCTEAAAATGSVAFDRKSFRRLPIGRQR